MRHFRTPSLLIAAGVAAYAAVPALMPLPVKLEPGSGSMAIDGSFRASATGCVDARISAAVDRMIARISRQTGIPIGLGEPPDAAHTALEVQCDAAGTSYPTLGEDESYTLDVTPSGARLHAATGAGALRGLETFAQWIAPGPHGFQAPAVHIEDRPRFAWRGLMLDVSRHWMPVPVVERNLDAMAAVKLNIFHWHLSDDQGFRVESKHFPKLQKDGSDGDYYTQGQIREVVEYARSRGIRVVPEFDIPGHTLSWFPGYPELTASPGPYSIGRTWGVFDPVMDPTREETYQLLDTFLAEMVQLFPDPYFHIGGDEVNGKQWTQTPRIMQFAREHHLDGPHGLQVYFNQRIQKMLAKHGKIMIGWDEILHPDLPQAAIIQSWRGAKYLADAAAAGHRGILSWGYYLDHLSPASEHYAVDPLGAAANLSSAQMSLILGGEACMWAEFVNAETVDSRIWPRMAAIAERFWSPKDTTDVASMYERMEVVSRNLEWTGVEHRSGYQPMLDRLAGAQPNEPLRVLADASQALGLGPRARVRKYTSLVPLNRLADAARPESEPARLLEQTATRYLASKDAIDAAMLREQFSRWAANHAQFEPLIQNNSLLSELEPLSKDLSALGAIGLRILDYLNGNAAVPSGWVDSQKQELTRMARPQAELVLAAVKPVRVLLDGLSRQVR